MDRAPFLGAGRTVCERAPIRPTAGETIGGEIKENVEKQIGAVVEEDETDVKWWKPKEIDEKDMGEEEPMKWWHKDTTGYVPYGDGEEEKYNGLGQDGLRDDPQPEEYEEEDDDDYHVEEEHGRKPKKKNGIVYKPSREEREDHERTHCQLLRHTRRQ